MDRRSFLRLLPGVTTGVSIAGMASCGITALKKDDKYVLVVDRSRAGIEQAIAFGQSLGVPAGTKIIPVNCNEGQRPEEAFALLKLDSE